MFTSKFQPQHILQSSFLVCSLTIIRYKAKAGPRGKPKPLTISALQAILKAWPSNSCKKNMYKQYNEM